MLRLRRILRWVVVLACFVLAGCGVEEASPQSVAPTATSSTTAVGDSPSTTRDSGSRAARICDLFAVPSAGDAASGTLKRPLGGIAAINRALRPGQTGCLRAGTFDATLTRITTPRTTLRSFPGERATIAGRLWADATDVHIFNLVLDSSEVAVGSTSPTVTAADVVFRGNEVTNAHLAGICFGLGADDGSGRAVRTVIEGNRIHDCGQLPPTNHHHGIYAAYTRDVVIRNNLIYGNADRGVQLYPDADGTTVAGNVIAGNGQGVIVSGDAVDISDGNSVTANVISGSVVRWNVESNWPDRVGSANVVRRNCVFSTNPGYDEQGGIQPAQVGFSAARNLVAPPLFTAPEAGDFTLAAGDPCLTTVGRSSPARAGGTSIP